MCLYTYQKKPFIAKEDIKCYKVLYYDDIDGKYITPVMGVKIPFIPCAIEPKGTDGPVGYIKNISPSHTNTYCIGKGYIHAYKDINKIYRPTHLKYVIVKCTIPKGTKYFKGLHFNENKVLKDYADILQESGNEICAKKMYLDKVVESFLIPKYIKYPWKKSLWQKMKSKLLRLFNVQV